MSASGRLKLSCEPPVVPHRDVPRRPVLLDRLGRRERREEIVVRAVVVGERHFARERCSAFRPEGVRDIGSSVRLSPGSSRTWSPGPRSSTLTSLSNAEAVFRRLVRAVDLEELDHEPRAAAVHDVLGLDHVVVMGARWPSRLMIAFSA